MAEQNLPGEYENPYKFNAKELDVETELYYYGASDGQHNGGVYFWGKIRIFIRTRIQLFILIRMESKVILSF